MGRFRDKLYRFMYGRYGTDELYNFLFVAFFVVWIIELITIAIIPKGLASTIVSLIFSLIMSLLIFFILFRFFSKNIYKRRRENEAYLKARRAISQFLNGNTSKKTKSSNVDTAEFVFRDCTRCGATLRLPRKSGKHKVKCPRCSHSFFVKSK